MSKRTRAHGWNRTTAQWKVTAALLRCAALVGIVNRG